MTDIPRFFGVAVHAKCLELGYVTTFGLLIDRDNADMPNFVGFRTMGNQRHFFPPESPVVVYSDVGKQLAADALAVDIEHSGRRT